MKEERQKGGPWGGKHSHDAPAFLLVPPPWTISWASTRSSGFFLKKVSLKPVAEPVSAGLFLHLVEGGLLRILKLVWVVHPDSCPVVKGKPQAGHPMSVITKVSV